MRARFRAELAIGWSTMFVIGTDLFVVSPLLPAIASDCRASPAAAGLSVTMFSLSYMLGAPLFGQMADRIGRRRVLLSSLLAFAAANGLTAAAPGLPALLAARAAAGLAAAGVSPSVYALIGGAAPADRRATWMAITVSGLLVSLALGAPIGTLAAAFLGWKSVFVVLALASLLLTWQNSRIWPNTSNAAGAPAALALPSAELASRLLPMVLWSTALYGMYTYLGAGLAASGLANTEIARSISFYGCGAIAGVLLGGRLADRFGAKPVLIAGLGGLSAGLLALHAALHSAIGAEIALIATSALAQLFFPAQQAGLANDFPTQRATVLAWNNSALFLGIMLGSVIGGQALRLSGFATDLAVCAGIALAGCLGIVAILPVRSRAAGDRPA